MITKIETKNAPAAIGPYAQGNVLNDLIFTSGQLPIDPVTGEFAGSDIKSQTAQSLKNIAAILETAGSSLDKVIKTTVFLIDLADFTEMNGVYAEFFGNDSLPSRTTVEISALPKGSRIEIEAIAYK